MALPRAPLHITEVFGLSPLRERWREAMLTLRGDPSTPPTRFDLSSLRILNPRLALPLWAGRPAHGRLVPIYNLVSHVRPPLDEGWSVRVTTARDFVGTQLTYDSHNGTDFAVPLGTAVVAAAPGVVRRVSREFHRGGLKVFIDHGAGVITSSNHLARPLVREGDRVRRGEVIALSGYSGIDGVVTFPWGAPHVHFNVWLDGEYVDPFALPGETSMWRAGNWPVPDDGSLVDETVTPTAWDEAAIDRGARACVHPGSRAEIDAAPTLDARAMALLFQMNYFPSRFTERPRVYLDRHPRAPRLDLPFRREDFDGVWFPHGVEPPR